MTGKTTIEWTHMPGFVGGVLNPTTGCTRVSAGCDNCYAFTLHDQRYAANLRCAKAHGYTREQLEDGTFRREHGELVGRKARLSTAAQYDRPFSAVQLLEERIEIPLRATKPTCYFVDSMADLFHEDVPDEFLWKAFYYWGLADAERHRFLILTKRPSRMRDFMIRRVAEVRRYADRFASTPTEEMRSSPAAIEARSRAERPYPHIWLGTSVEDQDAADLRIPHLLATPAAVRFLSCEPLLGPVNLGPIFADSFGAKVDWVIVGGESGDRARPMDLEWARSLVYQCRTWNIPVFVKQLGSRPVSRLTPHTITEYEIRESHGRDMAEWPEALRVREWPQGQNG